MRISERQLELVATFAHDLTDAPRGELRSEKMLPARILSLSPCIRGPRAHRDPVAKTYSVTVSLLPEDARAIEVEPLAGRREHEDRDAAGWGAPGSNPRVVAGYEIVSWENDAFRHSWLCMSLEARAYYEFGVRTGELGLLPSAEDALRLIKGIRDGTFPAEPGYWLIAHLRATER